MKKKIGILLPNSKAYPKLSKEFMAGLKLALPENFEIKIEGIGFGENSKQIKNAIQKLVYQENVSIITGLLGHKDLEDICEFVNSMDETLIFSNIGASTPLDLTKWSNIYCNSFQLNKSTYLLGSLFSKENFKKIGISTCYNDAGYGFNRILETAFNNEENVEFAGHFITPLYPRENEAELMLDFVKHTKPDAIFCSHNGIFAEEHAAFLKENKLSSQDIPMYMNPFSIGTEVLKKYPKVFNGVKSISSWFPELQNKENNSFIGSYIEKYSTTPSVFSLLGYENSLLIQKQLQEEKGIKVNFNGPRGSLYFDENTARTDYNHYLWNLKFENDSYKISQEKKIEQNHNLNYTFLSMESPIGGWNNSYLCH